MVLGAVPVATGAATLARGTSVVRDAPAMHPNVESEHRFLAVWWTALGPALWSLVPEVERRERAVRAFAATLFAGGLVRVATARRVGAPHPLYRALTAVELALPPVVVAWQESVRRSATRP